MGRLLGIVSATAIPGEILQTFGTLAETGKTPGEFGCPQPDPRPGHPDGWGVACLGEGEEVYLRGSGSAAEDPGFEDAVRTVTRVTNPPVLLLAHVRRTSVRDTNREEFAQPFRRLLDDRPAFFAHDGEIEGFGLQKGQTDTQYVFARFADALGGSTRDMKDVKRRIADAKETIDRDHPRRVASHTFLMLDGDRILAHRDARDCVPYYALHEHRSESMTLFCSEVLPGLPGRWRLLRNGEFVEALPPG